MKTAVLALLLAACTVPVRADEAKPPPLAEEKQALEKFASDHKDCREWSDGCMVCLRHDAEKFACSLPGVACQPTGLACRDPTPAPDKAPPAEPKK